MSITPEKVAELAAKANFHPTAQFLQCDHSQPVAEYLEAINDMAALIAAQAETIKRLETDAARVEALEKLLKRTVAYHNAHGSVVEPAATDIFIQAGHRDRCVTICLRRGHMDMKRHISAGNVRAAIDILINGGAEAIDDAIRQQGGKVGE